MVHLPFAQIPRHTAVQLSIILAFFIFRVDYMPALTLASRLRRWQGYMGWFVRCTDTLPYGNAQIFTLCT